MTVYKDGTALVKQEIIWSNIQKGKSTIKYDDIPKSIHKDTPFIKFDNAQVLNQRFVEKAFQVLIILVKRRKSNQYKTKEWKIYIWKAFRNIK